MPSRMTTRLMTVARTGRRMQMSDRTIARASAAAARRSRRGRGLGVAGDRRRRRLSTARGDGAAVAHLELAGRDHHVVAAETVDDLDAAVAPQAGRYLDPLRLAVDDAKDVLVG